MASIQSIEGTLTGIIKPPPKKDNDRYYNCGSYLTGIKCERTEHPDNKSNYSNTEIFTVKNYVPECFDKYILKYKCTQKWVSIEDNEPKTK